MVHAFNITKLDLLVKKNFITEHIFTAQFRAQRLINY